MKNENWINWFSRKNYQESLKDAVIKAGFTGTMNEPNSRMGSWYHTVIQESGTRIEVSLTNTGELQVHSITIKRKMTAAEAMNLLK